MTQQKEIPITAEMKAFIGKEEDRQVSPPVHANDIRKWAISVYWPETPPRLFWDEDYARKTPQGGIVAPEDFNPFAWALDPIKRGYEHLIVAAGGRMEPKIGSNVLNGGGSAEYHTRIRAGDVITSLTTVEDIYVRPGRAWPMLFIIRKSTWTNQKGELVKVYRSTSIRY